jgi:hypothetical protein
MTTRVPAGLTLSKGYDGWRITHTASRLPLHPGGFMAKADAVTALAALAALDVDWQLPRDQVRDAVRALPGGFDAVRAMVTPPEELERRRRVYANAGRYQDALAKAGETVVKRVSHGLAGTAYEYTCGCQRIYSVTFCGPGTGDPDEDLVPCDGHRDLAVVPAASTDLTDIHRELLRKS